jgi:hypothetical protein
MPIDEAMAASYKPPHLRRKADGSANHEPPEHGGGGHPTIHHIERHPQPGGGHKMIVHKHDGSKEEFNHDSLEESHAHEGELLSEHTDENAGEEQGEKACPDCGAEMSGGKCENCGYQEHE